MRDSIHQTQIDRGLGSLRILKRPEQLAKARKWFTTMGRYEARTDTHHWAVNVYEFSGDKLAKKDRREGIGKNAPRSAYR